MKGIITRSDPLRQEIFAVEYVRTLNQTESYMVAYPDSDRVSAASSAVRLMKNKRVVGLIRKYRGILAKEYGISAERLIGELKKVAFTSIRDIAKWGSHSVSLRDSEEIPGEAAAAIRKVAQTKEGVSVEMHNKLEAVSMLGKHLGLFNDKLDVNVKNEVTVDFGKLAAETLAQLKAVEAKGEVLE